MMKDCVCVCVYVYMDFPSGSGVKYLPAVFPACPRRHQRHRFDRWVGKIPWKRKWQPTPVFLPGKSHGLWSLAGYSLWGHKESDTTECMQYETESFHYTPESKTAL